MIRQPAARKCAETILSGGIVRIPITDTILNMTARQIMLAVEMDEQRQRSEKILGEDRKE